MINNSYARFVVRPHMKALIGWDGGVFENGMVYEAREILDEIVLRKIGPSVLSLPVTMESRITYHCSNGQNTEQLMEDGNYLLTIEEMKRRNKLYAPRES